MERIVGNLLKMDVQPDNPVGYHLRLGGQLVDMNALVGKNVRLRYQGRINCIRCGRETKTSFFQGYCYSCFISAPEAEECVLNPEKCRAHEGVARDMEFARDHCLIPHVVYLAESGGVKVGVTRYSQVPGRWIDQGASQAIELARTPNRYLAGVLEVALKKVMSDKTNWRKMLSASGDGENDMFRLKEEVIKLVPGGFLPYISEDVPVISLHYPVLRYAMKISSVNLEKEGEAGGVLSGIRGQYLIFDEGKVINIRKYGGYLVEMETD